MTETDTLKIYLLLPRGYQPSGDRWGNLSRFYEDLGGFQTGFSRKSHTLAIEFPEDAFNRLRENDREFRELIASLLELRYEGKHGVLRSHDVDFHQDLEEAEEMQNELAYRKLRRQVNAARREKRREEQSAHESLMAAENEKSLEEREAEIREQMGKHQLAQEGFRSHVSRFAEMAKWTPWVLAGCFALSTLGMGIAMYRTLRESNFEPISQRQIRVSGDPLNESFDTETEHAASEAKPPQENSP